MAQRTQRKKEMRNFQPQPYTTKQVHAILTVQQMKDATRPSKMSASVKPNFMDETHTIIFIFNYLTEKKLMEKLRPQITTLLSESRRCPALLTEDLQIERRGNRNRYGTLSFYIIKGAVHYSRSDLLKWLEVSVVPYLRTL
jgi:hypothetical protein